MNAVKLLNLTVLEPIVNDMTILTASMGTFEQYRSRKRRMLYHICSMGMDSYHVLAKCVLLDNIETNSCWL